MEIDELAELPATVTQLRGHVGMVRGWSPKMCPIRGCGKPLLLIEWPMRGLREICPRQVWRNKKGVWRISTAQ